MSDLMRRFHTRNPLLPRIAKVVGHDRSPVTRYVVVNMGSKTGTIWYAHSDVKRDQRVRCLYHPKEILSLEDLARDMLAWVQEGPIIDGWPEDTRTCEEVGDCPYDRSMAVIMGETR
jgi:hypothetical protein